MLRAANAGRALNGADSGVGTNGGSSAATARARAIC